MFSRGVSLQERPSGLMQLGSAPTRPAPELRSALSASGQQSARNPPAVPKAGSSLTVTPLWRPDPAPGPAVKGLSPPWQGSARTPSQHPQTLAPIPAPQALQVPPRPAHFRAWPPRSRGFRPSVRPSRSGPGAAPDSVGSRPARPSAPHPGSRAGNHIRRSCRSCSAAKSGPRRRPRPRPARAARGGASPRAGSHASQPPSG